MAYPGAKLSDSGSSSPPDYDINIPTKPQTWYVPNKPGPMMQYQGTLPRLPVPPLEQTLSMYLSSVKPLCNEQEWERTKSAVLEFLTGPQGPALQKQLLKRAEEKKDSSWLVDWWNELCYFGYRDPVTVWVSYYYEFVPDKWSGMKQTKRASGYVKAALRYRDLIRSETLPCDKSGGRPQDMSMYPFLFNSSRIAAPKKDHYVTYDKYYYNHIVVICNGHLFSLEVGTGNAELSAAQIESEFDKIIEETKGVSSPEPVSVLTSQKRDVWAEQREQIKNYSANNKKILEVIDSSAFVVCLDGTSPETAEDRQRSLWHGDGSNRWFDKPMQFVVFKNGQGGFVGEHGLMDGQPTTACTDWILSALSVKGIKGVDTKPVSSVKPPTKLQFTLPAPSIIASAFSSFNSLVKTQVLCPLNWTRFGKNGLKKLRISPDAFVQMAYQLAYTRLHGKPCATYEACSTRMYLHGRTETIRSCHIPGEAFVKGMDKSNLSATEKYKLLQKAAEHQSWYTKRAVQGAGCDRHLLGLKILADPNDTPSIFTDPIYKKSTSWVLSTSALVNEHFASWGFGEVVPEGYGVSYVIKKESLIVTITSLVDHEKPAPLLRRELERALTDMYDVCTAALQASSKL